jgi:hypothetical protein
MVEWVGLGRAAALWALPAALLIEALAQFGGLTTT